MSESVVPHNRSPTSMFPSTESNVRDGGMEGESRQGREGEGEGGRE